MKFSTLLMMLSLTGTLLYATPASEDQADICETELMACNSACDNESPTEACYQECQEKFEDCLAEVQGEGSAEPQEDDKKTTEE